LGVRFEILSQLDRETMEMTTKQLERTIARIKDFHTKTEGLINEIFGAKKLEAKATKPTKAKVEVKARKARAGREGGPNRSQLIRAYFEKHGMDSRPRDVIEALKKDGIVVAPALVSIVKHKLNGGAKTVVKKTKVLKTKASVVRKSGDPLPAVVQSVLEKNRDGLKLSDLTDKVKEAGYQYHGKKGDDGLKQNVFQCLYSLSKEKHHPGFEGTDPVVYRDKTSKRYMLNPKAKRSA
jgi:hypothetical protein